MFVPSYWKPSEISRWFLLLLLIAAHVAFLGALSFGRKVTGLGLRVLGPPETLSPQTFSCLKIGGSSSPPDPSVPADSQT